MSIFLTPSEVCCSILLLVCRRVDRQKTIPKTLLKLHFQWCMKFTFLALLYNFFEFWGNLPLSYYQCSWLLRFKWYLRPCHFVFKGLRYPSGLNMSICGLSMKLLLGCCLMLLVVFFGPLVPLSPGLFPWTIEWLR